MTTGFYLNIFFFSKARSEYKLTMKIQNQKVVIECHTMTLTLEFGLISNHDIFGDVHLSLTCCLYVTK